MENYKEFIKKIKNIYICTVHNGELHLLGMPGPLC